MLLLLCFFAEDTTCNVLKTLFSICIETLTVNIVFNITHVHVFSVETSRYRNSQCYSFRKILFCFDEESLTLFILVDFNMGYGMWEFRYIKT